MQLFKDIKAGEWGVAHGLASAGAIAVAWFLIPSYYAVAVVAIVSAFYWTQREAKARKTWDIRDWYTDSQLDAVVPIIVSGIAIYLRYF